MGLSLAMNSAKIETKNNKANNRAEKKPLLLALKFFNLRIVKGETFTSFLYFQNQS